MQTIWNLYNGPYENSAVLRYSTWQQVQTSMASNDRLLGLLLALFGIIALVAASCAIANVTAGRVLMQRQDIAMLKALGFTPGQVVRMLLAEQTLLGAAGAGLGLVAARIISSEFVRPPDGTPVSLAPLSGGWVALIGVGTVLTVAIATIIPAWWAGRVSPVAAVQPSPPRGHLSLIARLGLLVHLPAALVLGARDSLTRRLPAALTVIGLAIPMVMITIALTCWSTIDGFTKDPGRIGLAAAVTVSQGGLDDRQTTALISHDDQVLAYYPSAQFDTLLPGANGTFTARAMGYSWRPYPFHVVQGQMFDAPNQAIAGQGFLDLMHIGVGAWISPTIDGVPVILHIVGRTIEPDNNGDVLDFGLDALTEAGSAPQLQYNLVLKPGVSAAAARAELLEASHDQLDVQTVTNPADGLAVIRVVIAVLVIVLAIIGLANLLTATAVGVRDHRHEVGVLEAMGLTPRQVMATLVVNTTILTAIGVTDGNRRRRGDRAAADQHAGEDQRHRVGHRLAPGSRDDRGDPGRRAGHRHGHRAPAGPPDYPRVRSGAPAQPGSPAASAAARLLTALPLAATSARFPGCRPRALPWLPSPRASLAAVPARFPGCRPRALPWLPSRRAVPGRLRAALPRVPRLTPNGRQWSCSVE